MTPPASSPPIRLRPRGRRRRRPPGRCRYLAGPAAAPGDRRRRRGACASTSSAFLASQFLQLPEVTGRSRPRRPASRWCRQATRYGSDHPAGDRHDRAQGRGCDHGVDGRHRRHRHAPGTMAGSACRSTAGRIEVAPLESGIGEEPQVSGSERVIATLGERSGRADRRARDGGRDRRRSADRRPVASRRRPRKAASRSHDPRAPAEDERPDGAWTWSMTPRSKKNAAFTEDDTGAGAVRPTGLRRIGGRDSAGRADGVLRGDERAGGPAGGPGADGGGLPGPVRRARSAAAPVRNGGRPLRPGEPARRRRGQWLVDIAEARLGAGIDGLAGKRRPPCCSTSRHEET